MGCSNGCAWASQSIEVGSITVSWVTVERTVGSMVFGISFHIHLFTRVLRGERVFW